MSVAAKVAAMLVAAATGAAVPPTVKAMAPELLPKEPSIWAVIVLGIPLSVLAAALAASTLRSLREPSEPDAQIPRKVVGIVADGFIGGWAAIFLLSVPKTRALLGPVPPEVTGALCALLVQFVRVNGKVYFEQFYATVLGLFGRRKGAAADPPGGSP